MQPFCSRKKEQKQHHQEVEKYRKERKQGDQYESFKQLMRYERDGYEIEFHEKGGSDLLVFSPHGGDIEPGTSEIVEAFQESYSTYLFEGTKQDNNRDLHITSTNFDEPILVQMIKTYPFQFPSTAIKVIKDTRSLAAQMKNAKSSCTRTKKIGDFPQKWYKRRTAFWYRSQKYK